MGVGGAVQACGDATFGLVSRFVPISHVLAGNPHDRRSGVRRLLLGVTVAGVLLGGYLVTAVLLELTAGIASDSRLGPAAILAVALPGWLAAHQVPLIVDGVPLSALPLLPTVVVVLLIAIASGLVARRCRLRRPDQAWPVIATMGLAHGCVGAGFSLLLSAPFRVVPVEAFLSCGITAALAATAGVANRCGLFYLVWERIGAEVWTGLRYGLLATASLIAAGSTVVLLAVGVSAPDMVASMNRMGHAGDAIGATVTSLLYLPNAVLAGWSFAAGTGFSFGDLTVRPLQNTGGPVPDLPLLAVLPTGGPSVWWLGAMLLPLVTGLFLGVTVKRVHGAVSRRLLVVAVAAGIAAVAVWLLALLAGGRFGERAVSFQPLLLAVVTLGWLGLPAAVLTWLGGVEDPELDDEFEEFDEQPDDPELDDEAQDPLSDFEYTDLGDLIAEIPFARTESETTEALDEDGAQRETDAAEFDADAADSSTDSERR